MKLFRERAGVRTLANDVVLWIEQTCFGQERLSLFVLAKEAGSAGLLHEFGDVALVGDGVGFGVVVVVRVEFDRFVELNLRAGKVIAVEEARSCEIGVFCSLGLTLCR